MRSLASLPPLTALAGILLVAFSLRLGGVLAVGDRALEYEFATITHNLLAGHGYDFFTVEADGALTEAAPPGERTLASAYMPPAYPVFLWALTSVVGTGPAGIVAVEVVQVLLGVLGCWLMLAIGRELFDERTGLLAALGFAVYPLLAFTPSQISAAALYVVLFLLFLWLMARAVRTGRLGDVALAGVLFGLNVLARAEFVLFLPLALGWFWAARTPRRWRAVGVLAACAVVVLVPWTVRNAVVLGKATPLTTGGGLNLWVAYAPGSEGTHFTYTVPAPGPFPGLEADLAAIPRTDRYEVEADAVYREHARAEIARDPARVLRLGAKKVWLFWGHFGGEGVAYPGASSPLFWGPWVLLLPPFALGLWRSARSAPRRHAFLYAYLLGQTAVVTAFFVIPRYRLAVIPVMLLFAAAGVAWAWDRFRAPAAPPIPAAP